MEIKLPKQINILGYAEEVLAVIFEILTANKYSGEVQIFRNEKDKRAKAPFEADIPYKEYMFYQLKAKPFENNFLFCSTKSDTKKFLFDFYRELWDISQTGFINLMHPSSSVASSAQIKTGLYLGSLTKIGSYSTIGFGVNVHSNCSIGHHSILNDFCTIQPGVNTAGRVEVGEGSTIGIGSTLFYNVKIGKNTIIGGGSVVTTNIPDDCIAYGNPCKVIRQNYIPIIGNYTFDKTN